MAIITEGGGREDGEGGEGGQEKAEEEEEGGVEEVEEAEEEQQLGVWLLLWFTWIPGTACSNHTCPFC